jgi:hypothetical protein
MAERTLDVSESVPQHVPSIALNNPHTATAVENIRARIPSMSTMNRNDTTNLSNQTDPDGTNYTRAARRR